MKVMRSSAIKGTSRVAARELSGLIGMATKRSKYGNRRTEINGHSFASQAEARRYTQLKLLERAGTIRSLELQPRFPLVVEGEHICTYVGDFAYWEGERRVVEDVKGHRTNEYKIKRKLMKAKYKVDITEIEA